MFFLTIYGANLTAFFLTKEPLRQSVPFATFDELSRQTDVKYGYFPFGATSYYFKNSENAVDKKIFQTFSSDPSLGVSSSAEAFERVRSSNEKWAYIAESLLLGKKNETSFSNVAISTNLRRTEIPHSYQWDQSISVLKDVGCFFFIFNQMCQRTFYKETMETLIRRLILICTGFLCPTKRLARVKMIMYS